jgi:hypothetical protein
VSDDITFTVVYTIKNNVIDQQIDWDERRSIGGTSKLEPWQLEGLYKAMRNTSEQLEKVFWDQAGASRA